MPPAALSDWGGAFSDWKLLAFVYTDAHREVGDEWVTRAVWVLRLIQPYLLISIVVQAVGN